jgi:hypothetical protein
MTECYPFKTLSFDGMHCRYSKLLLQVEGKRIV